MLWAPFVDLFEKAVAGGAKYSDASRDAIEDAFRVQHQITVIPRYVREFIEDLWVFQFRLEAKVIRNPRRLMEHPRFKAAYDFLLLRAQAEEGSEVSEKAEYWREQFASFEKELLAREREEAREERRDVKQEVRREIDRHKGKVSQRPEHSTHNHGRSEQEGDAPKKRRRRPRRKRNKDQSGSKD